MQEEDQATIVPYQFAEDLADFKPDGPALGRRTDFGQALHSLFERHGHDRNIRAILVLSDGGDNGTRYPALSEASAWRGVSCPIYSFGFGKTTTPETRRDIALTTIACDPPSVAAKGKLTVRGLIDAPGFENAPVTLRLLLDDKEVATHKDALRQTTGNEISFPIDAPANAGEYKVTLKCDPLPGEVTLANNEISSYLTVTKEGISVLLIDKPRFPEPQLICDALGSDPRVRLFVAWLRTQDRASPSEDLFELQKQHYDVIILGDVSAHRLSAGRPEVLSKIRQLVAKQGAGLLMMGGYESLANSDWARTPLEDLIPVQLDVAGQFDDAWQMKPTQLGLNHYIMRLSDLPDANRKLWERLPKLDGLTRLGKEKAGASVLAVRAGTTEPVLVSQDFGAGRTLAFAGDTTWRWQRLGQPNSNEGIEAHMHFWKQVIFWLAKRDKAEGNLWIKLDARRLPAGSKLGFNLGLRGKGGLDIHDGRFEAKIAGPQGTEMVVPTAHDASGERGVFWKTDLPGEYRLVVRGEGKDVDGQPIGPHEASARFIVFQDDAEMIRQAADHDFLVRLASATGGKFQKAEELPRFLHNLLNSPLGQSKTKVEWLPDWHQSTSSGFRIGLLLAFVALLGLEWLLRRYWGMV
jgi:uncharacterized membrane protein